MAQTIDLSAYKNLYLQTAREHIGVIRNGLLMIRLNPEDKASLEKVHISAHSIKGQSLAMGYEKTALYARLLEYIFRDALDKKLELTPEKIACLKDSVTHIEESLASIEKNNKEIDLLDKQNALSKMCGIKVPAIKP